MIIKNIKAIKVLKDKEIRKLLTKGFLLLTGQIQLTL